MLDHGLFPGQPPPSVEVLMSWLRDRSIDVSDGVQVAPMEDGSGWRVVATRDLEPIECILKLPKPALLSIRTSSLPPLPTTDDPVTTSHTALGLTLALLHEIRLGPQSAFWGYIQSLPRETVPIPPLWPIVAVGNTTLGEDARQAARWLKCTEAERDIRRREMEGVGLDSMRQFYGAVSGRLPPTELHPHPSPFEAFAHCYSLVSTRAFVIDLYHQVALCPFADILNHSTSNHTSLACDDFVCCRCGSLPPCSHDGPDLDRLAHLTDNERGRLSSEDTVDMWIEWPVAAGAEVMNTYGDGLGDARLLVEWGFIPSEEGEDWRHDEDAMDGVACTWQPEEILGGLREMDVVEAADAAATRLVEELDEDSLLCRPTRGVYHLNHAGQVSLRIFAAYDATHAHLKSLVPDVRVLNDAWRQVQDGAELVPLPSHLVAAARDVRGLLQARVEGMHRSELDIGHLYDLRDALPSDARLQVMAMTVAINERALLQSAIARWDELLEAVE